MVRFMVKLEVWFMGMAKLRVSDIMDVVWI